MQIMSKNIFAVSLFAETANALKQAKPKITPQTIGINSSLI